MPPPTRTDESYARIFPVFHYFVLPVLGINSVNAIRHLWHRLARDTVWEVVVALALMVLALTARVMASAVQDRGSRSRME